MLGKRIVKQFRSDWIKYGFETIAIVVGILGAYYLSNWKEQRVEKETEMEYLSNLLVDLENQVENIQAQISFEEINKRTCEDLLAITQQAPFDIDSIHELFLNLQRRTFVVSSPVYEDLKYSGHLGTISDPQLRYSIFKLYQLVEYVETVIASNNANYVDRITVETLDMMITDYGLHPNFALHTGFRFNVDVEPFPEAEAIINKQLEDVELRFRLHNKITFRGRVSSLQITLLDNLLEENQLLIEQLKQILES